MSADLIVYGLVAAGLIFWLRSILGTRHGNEKSRPNPYMTPHETPTKGTGENESSQEGLANSSEEKIIALAKSPARGMSVDNKAAEEGLLDIARADKTFDVSLFLSRAQDAFAMVVESFGEGDRDSLKDLLAKPVYEAFDGAIKQREKNEETLQTEIHAIKKSEIIEASADKKMMYITVRFTAAETSVTKDSEGNILSGHPDKVSEMRDIWVFARPLRSRDPRWLVHETRGDFDGDNETIPNSDD